MALFKDAIDRSKSYYSAVLENDTLVSSEERFERSDDSTQVRLVLLVIVHPLRVKYVMHRYKTLLKTATIQTVT